VKTARWSCRENRKQIDGEQNMKTRTLIGMMVAVAMLGGSAVTAMAQNGCGYGYGGGRGHGGPPKSDQERAARQKACLEKNGGVCPNGGPRKDCPGYGQGGQGGGGGQGLRDGTGPRNGGTGPKGSMNRGK
jgi:hypothetical protein